MSAWIWEMLILVMALSVDTFAAGFVYGVSGVKVPGVSVWILTGVSGLLFVAALFVGGAAGRLLPEHLARVGAFGLGSSVAAGMGAFLLGKWCGRSLSCRFQTNLCWISGALLLLLAVIKLF